MEIVVYTIDEPVNMTAVKQKFFQDMGGQMNVNCQEHDLPLVCSKFKNSRLCSYEDCTTKAYYQCCYTECPACVCKDHFDAMKKTSESEDRTYYILPIQKECSVNSDTEDDEEDKTQAEATDREQEERSSTKSNHT